MSRNAVDDRRIIDVGNHGDGADQAPALRQPFRLEIQLIDCRRRQRIR